MLIFLAGLAVGIVLAFAAGFAWVIVTAPAPPEMKPYDEPR